MEPSTFSIWGLGSLLWVRSEPPVQVGNFNAPLGKGDGRGGKIMGGKSEGGEPEHANTWMHSTMGGKGWIMLVALLVGFFFHTRIYCMPRTRITATYTVSVVCSHYGTKVCCLC